MSVNQVSTFNSNWSYETVIFLNRNYLSVSNPITNFIRIDFIELYSNHYSDDEHERVLFSLSGENFNYDNLRDALETNYECVVNPHHNGKDCDTYFRLYFKESDDTHTVSGTQGIDNKKICELIRDDLYFELNYKYYNKYLSNREYFTSDEEYENALSTETH
jgi:hypothetical protein